ncbi:MAG: hypothetical protein Q9195_000870 [Heterodermia aff. obscurata]
MAVSTAKAFSLPGLPLEIQLLVLRECLTSKTPLLNHGKKPGGTHLTITNEPRGQDDICFAILATCKIYRDEGLKILYAYNHFTYGDMFDIQRTWWSPLPVIPAELTPESSNRHPKHHFSNLTKLILRTMGLTEHLGPWITVMCCEHLAPKCPHLQTLQLDIVSLPREFPKFEMKELRIMDRLIGKTEIWAYRAQKRCQERSERRAANGGLHQLVVTGLGADFCGLLAVKQALCLLADGGKLGVGMGRKGRRFNGKVQEKDVILEPLPEPSLTWLDFQDVGQWIEENREKYDPHGMCRKFEDANRGTWPALDA